MCQKKDTKQSKTILHSAYPVKQTEPVVSEHDKDNPKHLEDFNAVLSRATSNDQAKGQT